MLFEANPEVDIREQSPLNLAFVGDGVFASGWWNAPAWCPASCTRPA